MKRHPVSMKEEREILISAIKDLVDVKHRLADLSDSEAETADLPELHDTSGAQVLVEDVVHPVHDRLDVRRG